MYQEMFSRYEELGGPVPDGPGIIVVGNWRQSWHNLITYWNIVLEVEKSRNGKDEVFESEKALECIAMVHAEYFGIPKLEQPMAAGEAW